MNKLMKLIIFLLFVWFFIYIWPAKKRPERAFYRSDDADILVIAHRGGKGIAPEGTLTAFDQAYELGVDIFEFDIHLTKDGELVVIHDETVDRTTDGTGNVNDLTLNEIKKLDAGYHFKDEAGSYIFRRKGVKIPTVVEVFEKYPNMRHLIEMKDTNRPELYEEMIEKLWELIQAYNMEDNVMIGSFDHQINERFEEVTGGKIPIGAGEDAVREFATKHVPFLNGLAPSNVDSLQLPLEGDGHNLTTRNIINSAKKRNMSIYYWTINDKETMRELIDKNVDGIMTDYPDRLLEVLNEGKE